MYESFYGLRAKPFGLFPDPDFLYLGARHKMALCLLEYGLLNQGVFLVITGQPGTGKTTLLNRVLGESQHRFTIGVISNTHSMLGSLMPWIFTAFGLNGKGKDSVELFTDFSTFLREEHAQRRRVLLVVDEAQNLDPPMLEELRLLSNLSDGKRQTLQIILSGQPGLRTLLQGPTLTQFAQRIAVDYNLEPLAEEDAYAYIRHRINVAGGSRPLFTQQASTVVFRLTGGIPRLMNQVCDTALAYGFAEQSKWVTAKLVIQAATDRSRGGILPLAEGELSLSLTKDQEEQEAREVVQFETAHQERQATVPTAGRVRDGAATLYKRALAYKKAGELKLAINQFEQAAREDRAYHLRALTQAGLCLQASGRLEEAVAAFRLALEAQESTSQDIQKVRYLLGRTLELSGRTPEALEAYHGLEREDPGFRDVSLRLKSLARGHPSAGRSTRHSNGTWRGLLVRGWHHLLRSSP